MKYLKIYEDIDWDDFDDEEDEPNSKVDKYIDIVEKLNGNILKISKHGFSFNYAFQSNKTGKFAIYNFKPLDNELEEITYLANLPGELFGDIVIVPTEKSVMDAIMVFESDINEDIDWDFDEEEEQPYTELKVGDTFEVDVDALYNKYEYWTNVLNKGQHKVEFIRLKTTFYGKLKCVDTGDYFVPYEFCIKVN